MNKWHQGAFRQVKRSVLLYLVHTTLPSNALSVCPPSDVISQMNAPQFSATVIQNTTRNDGFLVLWRNFCCAMSAPGQPPASDNKCKVLSWVRQAPFRAADLSIAYIINVNRLATR